jgi:hypothetical protein
MDLPGCNLSNFFAVGADGSVVRFHENAQTTINADGVVTVSFDRAICG